MKACFLYEGPHPAHVEWARTIDAEFISNRLGTFRVPNLSRLLKSITILEEIPSNTDLLLCEGGAEILTGALWKRRNPEGKVVLIVDDPKLYLLPKMRPWEKKLYGWALQFFDLFIPTTPLMENFIPLYLRNRSKIVELFVDAEHYSGRPSTERNVIFVGRVGHEKGVDRIIETFNILLEDFPESRLFIVGDGPLKNKLERKTGKNVIWTGYMDDPKIYFEKASIYLNLARIEPAGIAVLEGMCMGLVPVITEDVGFNYVVGKVSRELIVKNPKEAEEVIKNLWTHKDLFDKYSQNSRKVSRVYTEEKSVKNFKSTIHSLW